MIIQAAEGDKDGLGLDRSRSDIPAAPEFPVLPRSFFWLSSYLNTAKKEVIVFSGFLPLCTAGNGF